MASADPTPLPVHNAPLKSLHFQGMTIEGYSRAAVQTYWRIPEMKLGFDLGAHPWEFMGTPNWFISHTHLDHIAALPVYVARRRMMKMEPPTIYLPEPAVETVQKLLHVISRLDRGRLPVRLVGVNPGQEIELSRELVVTACRTFHTVPSLGYIVSERRRKLKPEYQELTGDQIRDLRLSGQEVTEERRIPRVAFLGDSTAQGLDENPMMYEADVLITEMTFVDPRHRSQKIHKMGHMHLDDLVARQDRFKNQRILAGHLSTRYEKRQVDRLVKRAFPDMLGDRLVVWL
jgi:ribonuclease Z